MMIVNNVSQGIPNKSTNAALLGQYEITYPHTFRSQMQHCHGNGINVSLCKVVPGPCHEDVWGSGSIAPLILDLSTRWKCVVSFMPQLF
jgi:hypothetical protein